jgi:hypothetical protein
MPCAGPAVLSEPIAAGKTGVAGWESNGGELLRIRHRGTFGGEFGGTNQYESDQQ